MKDYTSEEKIRIFVGIMLILLWISIPLYLQLRHGISAVKASFAITVIYYLVFRIWKWRKRGQS